MSLYHETADFLSSSSDAGGSLKSRIFSKKDLKSQPAQVYALGIESCKWSSVLKEVIENADILRLERKITPVLSVLLVHDLLLAKRGIALPATHGLRTCVERHKARLGAEFTKARIRRKLSSLDAMKTHVEAGLENGTDNCEAPYPRWLRINPLKTSIEDQLETTFTGYERAATVEGVRQRGSKRIFIDVNIPNLVAISPNIDLSKSDAYRTGEIIFQDKASCFPAYLLDPLPEDGDIIDTCSAPGNKTTHLAAILLSHNPEADEGSQKIHAFEKNKARAETLEKMVNLAGSQTLTKLHPGQDFLKTDPDAPTFKNVGALLLDPSCSGSGIIGREEMPELHLPVLKQGGASSKNMKLPNSSEQSKESRKRKRDKASDQLDVLVDDDGAVTAVDNEEELKTRLSALSKFQLELLLHAFKFPSARKITYSTCSIYAEENEDVVSKALDSEIAKERGWRILSRENQIRGMREWPVRGSSGACGGDASIEESCIRAHKDDEHGTMGFFLAAFTREQRVPDDIELQFLRDGRGHLVRDLLGFPVRELPEEPRDAFKVTATEPYTNEAHSVEDDKEWAGFEDDDDDKEQEEPIRAGNNTPPRGEQRTRVHLPSRHSPAAVKTREELGSQKRKRKKRKQ